MKIPSRNTIYVERRSLDDFDVEAKGTPGHVVMSLLRAEKLNGPEDDPEELLLEMMNNIWYVCAAVAVHPRAYLHMEEYGRLVQSYYANSAYNWRRKDATFGAVYMLLTKACAGKKGVRNFLLGMDDESGKIFTQINVIHRMLEGIDWIKTMLSLDDFAGRPTTRTAMQAKEQAEGVVPDARDAKIEELCAKLEKRNRQLEEAQQRMAEYVKELHELDRQMMPMPYDPTKIMLEQVKQENEELCRRLAEQEVQPADGILKDLVDKALYWSDETCLKELLVWLTTMEGAERAKAQAKRVEQRLKELKAPVPHTQHNYYAGANHISGSELKGVNIGTTPANRTLTQE